MAFHRAGLAVSHLSRASHGFSGSRLGVRVLNPIHTKVEDRYLRNGSRCRSTAAMAARYAGRLTPYVLKCPGKWSGWFHL